MKKFIIVMTCIAVGQACFGSEFITVDRSESFNKAKPLPPLPTEQGSNSSADDLSKKALKPAEKPEWERRRTTIRKTTAGWLSSYVNEEQRKHLMAQKDKFRKLILELEAVRTKYIEEKKKRLEEAQRAPHSQDRDLQKMEADIAKLMHRINTLGQGLISNIKELIKKIKEDKKLYRLQQSKPQDKLLEVSGDLVESKEVASAKNALRELNIALNDVVLNCEHTDDKHWQQVAKIACHKAANQMVGWVHGKENAAKKMEVLTKKRDELKSQIRTGKLVCLLGMWGGSPEENICTLAKSMNSSPGALRALLGGSIAYMYPDGMNVFKEVNMHTQGDYLEVEFDFSEFDKKAPWSGFEIPREELDEYGRIYLTYVQSLYREPHCAPYSSKDDFILEFEAVKRLTREWHKIAEKVLTHTHQKDRTEADAIESIDEAQEDLWKKASSHYRSCVQDDKVRFGVELVQKAIGLIDMLYDTRISSTDDKENELLLNAYHAFIEDVFH